MHFLESVLFFVWANRSSVQIQGGLFTGATRWNCTDLWSRRIETQCIVAHSLTSSITLQRICVTDRVCPVAIYIHSVLLQFVYWFAGAIYSFKSLDLQRSTLNLILLNFQRVQKTACRAFENLNSNFYKWHKDRILQSTGFRCYTWCVKTFKASNILIKTCFFRSEIFIAWTSWVS